ncbi:adenosylcobinamide-GDP ribazoletransferase [Aliiroseovarius marinus]|uniref:adenosylcobinamide-GDP ribazoletransferase n=1 Tax=Aliiroseovarius marinus TaxID=2500159 RepID=UPI003D7CA7BF
MNDSSQRQMQALARISDIPAAIGLLTRLPIRVDTTKAIARGAQAAWAWPLVGAIPALALWGVASLALNAGLPALWAATLGLLVQVVLTGAMHEDGLSDSADGLWGGFERTRRLEIMKDSRIGAYGVIALILSLLLRATALAVILPLPGAIWALVVIGLVSRLPMVLLMGSLPNARDDGLAHHVGRPGAATMGLASSLVAVVTLVLCPWAIAPLLVICSAGTIAVAALAKGKIGGQTGDILGASQQVTEVLALAVFAALMA